MRVARISPGLACGLTGILLIGASGIVAVGILLGQRDGWPVAPGPSRSTIHMEGAIRSEAERTRAPGRPHAHRRACWLARCSNR